MRKRGFGKVLPRPSYYLRERATRERERFKRWTYSYYIRGLFCLLNYMETQF